MAHLTDAQNERLRAAMQRVLEERFGGNRTKLALALHRSQPSISDILNGRGASYQTAQRFAALIGDDVDVLLGIPTARDPAGSPQAEAVAAAAPHQLGERIVRIDNEHTGVYSDAEIVAAVASAIESYDSDQDGERGPMDWAEAILEELRFERRRRARAGQQARARASAGLPAPTTAYQAPPMVYDPEMPDALPARNDGLRLAHSEGADLGALTALRFGCEYDTPEHARWSMAQWKNAAHALSYDERARAHREGRGPMPDAATTRAPKLGTAPRAQRSSRHDAPSADIAKRTVTRKGR